MRNNLTWRPLFAAIVFSALLLNSFNAGAQCGNADFESGNFNGWRGTWGDGICQGFLYLGICQGCLIPAPYQYAVLNQGPMNGGPTDIYADAHIMNSGYDQNLLSLGDSLPVVWPGGGQFSACTGNIEPQDGSALESGSLSYTFVVTPDNDVFTYHNALVFTFGGHLQNEEAWFKVRMVTSHGDTIGCASYDMNAGLATTTPGYTYKLDPEGIAVYHHNWTTTIVPLGGYIGDTVTITFTHNQCMPQGCGGIHYCYAYIDCECGKPNILTASASGCGGRAPSLTAPAGLGSYSWTGPGILSSPDSQTISINRAGHYTVTVSNPGSPLCTSTIDTTVVIDSTYAHANFSASGTSCLGSTTSFTDLSSPGGHIISWSWDFNNDGVPDATTQNPSHVFPDTGVHRVHLITHTLTCTTDTFINVVVSNGLTSTFTIPAQICIYDSANIVYTGNGTDSSSYTWNFGGGTATPGTGRIPGKINWATTGTKTVSLTVQQGGCSSALTTSSVVVNPKPVVTVSADTTICSGSSVTLAASGASTYQWSPATGLSGVNTASVNASPTVTTTYTVTGTTNNCKATASSTVNVSGLPPTSDFVISPPVICTGADVGIAYNGNAPSSATFNWNFDGGTAAQILPGIYSVKWATAGTKNVTLTVVQGACTSTQFSSPVTVNATPVVNITGNTFLCHPQTVTLTANGANTYQWASNPTIDSTNGANAVVTPLNTTTYTVTGTNTAGNCTASASVTVFVGGAPSSNFTVTSPICLGDSATVLYTGGALGAGYNWNFGGGNAVPAGGPGPIKVNWSTVGTKIISLVVSSGSCASITTDTVIVNTILPIAVSHDTAICAGQSVLLSASGGTSYQWSPATGLNSTNGASVIATPLARTTYVVAASASGCSATDSVTITVTAKPTSTFTVVSPVCAGQNSILTYTGTGNGGATYNWNFANGNATPGSGQGPISIYWPAAGTNTVSLAVSQAGCRSDTTTAQITVNPIPSGSFTVIPSICASQNDSIRYTGNASNSASYSWSFDGGAVTSGTGAGPYAVNWTAAGTKTISLSVTDNGCTSTLTTLPVAVNALPVSSFITDTPICALRNDTITFTGSASISAVYTWSFAGATVISGSGVGPYIVNWASAGVKTVSLNVKDNGCVSGLTSIPVTVNTTPSGTFTVNSQTCVLLNDAINYAGNASGSATFVWSFDGGVIASGSGAGPYAVNWASSGTKNISLMVSDNGCSSALTTIPVLVNDNPTSSFTAISPVCTNTNSTISYTGNGSGAAGYTWSFDGGVVANGTGAGPYNIAWASAGTKSVTLMVADNGCSSPVTTVPVTVNAGPVLTLSADTSVCFGGVVNLTAGGAGAYVWGTDSAVNISTVSTVHVSPSNTTTYIVTGSSNNCSSTDSVTVTVNPIPSALFTINGPVCSGEPVTLTFTGSAILGATFNWNFGSGTASTDSGQGPIQVQWDTAGPALVTLAVSQYGCSTTFADTLTIQTCTGVNDLTAAALKIYPDPSNGSFIIETTGAIETGKLQIYDVLGKVLYTDELGGVAAGYTKQIQLDVAAGVYLLVIRDGKNLYTHKLLIQ